MSTNIYQFTSNQSVNSRPNIAPQGGLKEMAIDIDQLVELTKTELQEFKASGLKNPAEFLKKKKVMAFGEPIVDDVQIGFKPPKIAYQEKKEVFLPGENQTYSDIKSSITYSRPPPRSPHVNSPAQIPGGSSIQSSVPVYTGQATQSVYYVQGTPQAYNGNPVTYTYAPNSSQVTYVQPGQTYQYSQGSSNEYHYNASHK